MSDAITLVFSECSFSNASLLWPVGTNVKRPNQVTGTFQVSFQTSFSSLRCQLWKLIFYVEGASLKGLMIVQRDSYSDQGTFTLFSRNLKCKVLSLLLLFSC